ncbi:alcohol dehydrogenase catalytic domain-containing protein [Mesorhizobium sp. M0140]|uniref:alcohol dehydrogenase catalytic domain-containing protein n=1 Tax=Mesorhizobium sp. M0140 TaxID=2956893 RepID=UPI003339C24F
MAPIRSPFYPRVIGHEFAGTVTALGRHVTGVAVGGGRAVVDPVVSCGHCYPCRIGRSNVCANLEVIGVHRDGGFRNFVAVPAHNAIPIPADMPFSLAALAEPISIAANVLDRTGCGSDDTLLIRVPEPSASRCCRLAKCMVPAASGRHR